MTTFRNEPLLELRREAVRREALAALAALDAKLPLEVPMLIGEDVVDGPPLRLGRPGAARRRIVAHAHERHRRSTSRDAIAARRARPARLVAQRPPPSAPPRSRAPPASCAPAASSSPRWPSARPASRGPRPTATSARRSTSSSTTPQGALALDDGRPLLQLPGERNAMRYVARGVTGVIAPWNFPLAIAAGMVSAALATGNAVVLKPAEQAPACAKAVVDALHAGGVPLDALRLLPGGDEPGKALVADPRIHTIVFTGSCAAGLQDPRDAPPRSSRASATSSA